MVAFAILADCRKKIKENKKIDKIFDLSREMNNQRKMRLTVIPIVVGALGKVYRSLERSEIPVMLELWEMQNPPSLTSLQGLLWPRVVASDKILSMRQIELKCVFTLN